MSRKRPRATTTGNLEWTQATLHLDQLPPQIHRVGCTRERNDMFEYSIPRQSRTAMAVSAG